MSKKFQVYGLGNALVDLQLQVPDTVLGELGFEKATMRLVEADEQEQLLERVHGGEPKRTSGGSVANSMIAIAQLGGKTAYGCRVADDALGRFYLDEMTQLGVHLPSSAARGERTGTCVVLITPDAERTMRTHLGASAAYSISQVSEDVIAQSEWLFIEGYLFAQEGGREAIVQAVKLANQHQTKIAVTVSEAFIVEVFGDALREATASATLLFANASEAMKFAGVNDEEGAFARLKTVVPNCVMTRSEKGAWINFDGIESRISSYPVKAVDDTGAGDMFAGGFLWGINNGMTGESAGKLGCFLASRVVSQLGARLHQDVRALANSGGFVLRQV